MPIPVLPGAAAKVKAKAKTVTGNQIAADALRYRGAGYVYGGSAARPGDWDCSSFVSYVLGHDLGLALPGGRFGQPGFPPNAHGPVVTSYAGWSGAVTVRTPARGDLVCFVGEGVNGHIGIVLGPNQMVSALDTASGTLVSPIAGYGPPGAPIVYRRVMAAAAGTAAGRVTAATTTAATVTSQALGGLGLGAVAESMLIVGVMVGVVIVGSMVVGMAAAAGASWLIMKLGSDA